jgi:hypothetical protein
MPFLDWLARSWGHLLSDATREVGTRGYSIPDCHRFSMPRHGVEAAASLSYKGLGMSK